MAGRLLQFDPGSATHAQHGERGEKEQSGCRPRSARVVALEPGLCWGWNGLAKAGQETTVRRGNSYV